MQSGSGVQGSVSRGALIGIVALLLGIGLGVAGGFVLWAKPPTPGTPINTEVVVRGLVNQSGAPGATRILVVVENVTYDVSYSFSVTREHCDQSEEWEVEFEANVTVNRTYIVVLAVNGTVVASRNIYIDLGNPPINFMATFQATWTAAIWEG